MNRTSKNLLHEATLAVLKRTGVRVESEAALDLLAAHGVRMDKKSARVFPGVKHIEQALATTPKSFRLYGRGTQHPLAVGGANPLIMAGGASVRVLTLEGAYEEARWEHLRQFNRLLDALPNIHILLNQVDPAGQSAALYRNLAAEMLAGSPKPCCLQAGDESDVAAMQAMGVALRGSAAALAAKPVFFTGGNAEPPLCIPGKMAGIIMAAGRFGIPCGLGDYVMMGITAPRTLEGALVQRNAVQLTALLLAQTAHPGAPWYYVGASGSAGMATLDPVMADPHAARMLRASVELGRSYGLPVCGLAPTDSKMPDAQAACERAAILMMVQQAGAAMIQGPTSMMDQMMLSSFTQAVIDSDIAGYINAVHQPLAITAENLALDAIHEVTTDPELSGLKFAGHPHTIKHQHDVDWHPLVFDYGTFAAWKQRGGPDIEERAGTVVRRILQEHEPEPLPDDLARELRRIAQETQT